MPREWQLEFVPVTLPERETVVASRAYYAALKADPGRIYDFAGAAYTLIQQQGMRQDDAQTWVRAAKMAQISRFAAGWQKVSADTVKKPYEDLLAYEVSATPSLAIGGRYIITPDDTNGDKELFIQLASAMVSKSM